MVEEERFNGGARQGPHVPAQHHVHACMVILESATGVRLTEVIVGLSTEDVLYHTVRVDHSSRARVPIRPSRQHPVAVDVTVRRLRSPVGRKAVPDGAPVVAEMLRRKYSRVAGSRQRAVESRVEVRHAARRTVTLYRGLESTHGNSNLRLHDTKPVLHSWLYNRLYGVNGTLQCGLENNTIN